MPEKSPSGGGGTGVFDSSDALAINRARLDHLASLGLPLDGRSVLDAGCGVGHLAQFFVERGCRVVCVDGRRDNIEQLRVLYPGLDAHVGNIETDCLSCHGKFDIVFCYGLLYHLENPLAGLRNVADACAEILLLETVVCDHSLPMLRIEDEANITPNQTLDRFGSRPSPSFVTLALARMGFAFVYAPADSPSHPDFQFEWRDSMECSRDGHLLRCVFVASRLELRNDRLVQLWPMTPASGRQPELGIEKQLRDACVASDRRFSETGDNPRVFRPGRAIWNQRHALAEMRERISALSLAIGHPSDCLPYQFTQLLAAAMDYAPDVILELGRDHGNSTCAFLEASHRKQGGVRVVSVCNSSDWWDTSAPALRALVAEGWFTPLEAVREDVLTFDYARALAGARRVLLFWDVHGFDVAECVLGEILPLIAGIEHVVVMHDLTDNRYLSSELMEYGPHGLWKGRNDFSGRRVKIGHVESSVEQSIAVLDFATRNRLTFDSADNSLHEHLGPEELAELKSLLGGLFDTQAHWFYFTLNEHPGPYTFPLFIKPRKKALWWK